MQPDEPIWITPCELERVSDHNCKLLIAMRVVLIHQKTNPKHGISLEENQIRIYFNELAKLADLDYDVVPSILREWQEQNIFVLKMEKKTKDKHQWITLTPLPPQEGPRLITATEAAVFHRRLLRILGYVRLLEDPSLDLLATSVGISKTSLREKLRALSKCISYDGKKIKHIKYL